MHLLHGNITDTILAGFFATYDELAFGYHEVLCAKALEIDLLGRGLRVRREVGVPVSFRGRQIGVQRLDMLVEEVVVVEVKAVETLNAAAVRQTRSYLRGIRLEVGLVVNFGIRAEFRRVLLTNDRKQRVSGLDGVGHGGDGRGTDTARTTSPVEEAATSDPP